MGGQCLWPGERLTSGPQYRRVFREGVRLDGPLFSLLALENGRCGDRLGLAAGRRLGGAVVRNRVKRLLRESFRRNKRQGAKGLDLVLVPKPGMVTLGQEAVEREYQKRLRLLAGRRTWSRRVPPPAPGD